MSKFDKLVEKTLNEYGAAIGSSVVKKALPFVAKTLGMKALGKGVQAAQKLSGKARDVVAGEDVSAGSMADIDPAALSIGKDYASPFVKLGTKFDWDKWFKTQHNIDPKMPIFKGPEGADALKDLTGQILKKSSPNIRHQHLSRVGIDKYKQIPGIQMPVPFKQPSKWPHQPGN